MPNYDLQCNMCGFEEERMISIHWDSIEEPLGCTKGGVCAGIMEKVYKVAPAIDPHALPTRNRANGIKYSVSPKKRT